MYGSAELLISHSCLEERAGGSGLYIWSEERQSFPPGEGFKGEDELHMSLLLNAGYSLQIVYQFLLIEQISRSHVKNHKNKNKAKIIKKQR